MLKSDTVTGNDRGATAIFLAITMFLLIGMAAIAIDVGSAIVERRADQTAADLGAIAGALEIPLGTSGGGVSPDDMVTSALEYVRQNLPIQYDPAEWQALWEGCVDPASERNTEPGDNFVPMSPPAGWTVGPDWCISRDVAKSLFRVHIPDQVVPTSFARVIGFNELNTHAAAVANTLAAGAGILPFGFPSGAADGEQQCLSSAPGGLALPPCDGPSSGNFGVILGRLFTPSPYNGCNAAPTNPVLALNIAAGIDHIVVPFPEDDWPDISNEIRDYCFNADVDTLQTDPGFASGVEPGLATGAGLPAGETALLRQGPQTKKNVVGNQLDDAPLWKWLLSGLDYGGGSTPAIPADDAPLFCDPLSFTSPQYDFGTGLVSQYDFDIDGDGMGDGLAPLDSWQHMAQCLMDYAAAPDGTYTVIFSSDLGDRDPDSGLPDWSARFAYAPQFYEGTLGPGKRWRHIWRFRAIFIEGTWWKRGNTERIHYPGETCTPTCDGNNYQLTQVSAFIIPDLALPTELRGDPPSGGFINPFTVLLAR